MDTTVAQKAAAWWANHLRSTPRMNNGDDTQSLVLSLMRGRMPRLSGEEIERFEQALVAELEGKPDHCIIDYDYDPDSTLQAAARAADVDLTSRMPVKTMMWIDGEKITASLGYGTAEEVV